VRDPLLALGVLTVAAALLWLWLGSRQARAVRAGAADLVETYGAREAGALVLAFTAPDCAPCRTVQRPALEALEQQYPGRIVIGEVDALIEQRLAARFGILTVPSTVVIGPAGDVRAINNGTATTERLAAQVGLNGQPADIGM
jgi:thiol-disulfide isomerase/thioredoxin